MSSSFLDHLSTEIDVLKRSGLYKEERILASPQQAEINTNQHTHLLNLCANNYLGLSNHPTLVHAAQKALEQYGYGMSSVRFICGTHTVHKTLENALSDFLKTQDTVLYSSCFDANTGLFETLFTEQDAIISDSLNHASIIDGIRLCKAARYRYQNNDMNDLKAKLIATKGARFKLIATDGVFSMDGILANLPDICELADKYQALVMVDDSHAVGFMGNTGAGTPEYFGVQERVDIITGTLGKALGGASGGYTASRQEIVEWLRQRSRPYLFSNSLAPMIASTSIEALRVITSQPNLRETLHNNSRFFRNGLMQLGFTLVPGEHPIIPVMLGDAKLAVEMSNRLLEETIYVVAFSYPVVPKGLARIRMQMNAAMTHAQLEHALTAFEKVGKQLGVIS